MDYLSVTDLRGMINSYLLFIYLTVFCCIAIACIVDTCVVAAYLILTDFGYYCADYSACYVPESLSYRLQFQQN